MEVREGQVWYNPEFDEITLIAEENFDVIGYLSMEGFLQDLDKLCLVQHEDSEYSLMVLRKDTVLNEFIYLGMLEEHECICGMCEGVRTR